MPAAALDAGPRPVATFDVVGEHAAGSRFVRHVALSQQPHGHVAARGGVESVHMRPPLAVGDTVAADVWGSVPLTNDEIRQIKVWLRKARDEYVCHQVGKVGQYTAHPAWRDVVDSGSGTLRYRRYSCAGFVLRAHHEADIGLLPLVQDGRGDYVVDEAQLPEVARETAEAVYPIAEIPSDTLADWGLEGPGPWPVVLPGYLLHALDRTGTEIRRGPYTPSADDAEF